MGYNYNKMDLRITNLSSVKSGLLFISPAQHLDMILYKSGWQCEGRSNLYPSRTRLITSLAPIPGYGVEPVRFDI